MATVLAEARYAITQGERGYRIFEKWRGQEHDLFAQDLEESGAYRYAELLLCATESGCFAIDEAMTAMIEPEGNWRVFGRDGRIYGRFETVGFALLYVLNPLSRMAHGLTEVPKAWNPLYIYVKEPDAWIN